MPQLTPAGEPPSSAGHRGTPGVGPFVVLVTGAVGASVVVSGGRVVVGVVCGGGVGAGVTAASVVVGAPPVGVKTKPQMNCNDDVTGGIVPKPKPLSSTT